MLKGVIPVLAAKALTDAPAAWSAAALGAFLGHLFPVFFGFRGGKGVATAPSAVTALAWQLGHNDFARPDQLSAYMGVHVTLTGIRGATAPFLGMFLYVGWDLGWFSFDGMHEGLFLLAAGLSAISGGPPWFNLPRRSP